MLFGLDKVTWYLSSVALEKFVYATPSQPFVGNSFL